MSKTTLDEKLREILLSLAVRNTGREHPTLIGEELAAIHAAFKEDGYVQVPTATKSEDGWVDVSHAQKVRHNGVELMSGQEFYDGFVKEYHMRADWISADPSMGDDAEHDVLLAARLAAGVTHN